MEMVQSAADVKLHHVIYAGVAPAVAAFSGGEIQAYCSDVTGAVSGDLENVAARIVITPQREWIRIAGFVLIGAGVAGILASVALILFGVRARSRAA